MIGYFKGTWLGADWLVRKEHETAWNASWLNDWLFS